MDKKAELSSMLRIAFLACAGLAAILQAIAVTVSYSNGSNYFDTDAILPILSAVLVVGGVICGTVAACTTDPKALRDTPFSERNSFPISAIGFFLTAILLPLHAPTERMTLTVVTSILLIVAALYSLLSSRADFRKQHEGLLALLGMASVVGCILAAAYFYFDVTVEMNAPLKIAVQLGLITAMLCYTGEIRYLIGKPLPRVYLTVASWSVATGALAMLSIPIAYVTEKLPRLDYAGGAVLVFCLVLTQILRMGTLLKAPAENTEQKTDNANDADGTTDEDGKDLT